MTMAKKTATHHRTSTGITHYRASAPIVVRVPSSEPRRSAKKGKHKTGRQSSEKVLMGLAMGGFAMGFLDKPGGPGANIPTIPLLGKAGTIAVVAHFFG